MRAYADMTTDLDTAAEVNQPYGFQGTRLDANSGNNHSRNRDNRTSLGRWTQQDPAGYVDGLSLYAAFKSSPTVRRDPMGTFVASEAGQIGNLNQVMTDVMTAVNDASKGSDFEMADLAVRTGASSMIGQTDSTANNSLAHRYLYTCRCGLIDMRHFIQLAYLSYSPLFSNESAVQQGIKHEEKAEPQSRYAPEDITSNALGAYFGDRLEDAEPGLGAVDKDRFQRRLTKLLQACNPVDWSKLSQQQRDCIVSWYDVSPGGAGNNHRKSVVANDGDCCKVCDNKKTDFPFKIDPKNASLIIGRK